MTQVRVRPVSEIESAVVLSKGCYPQPGGIERYTWLVALAYDAEGLHTTLISATNDGLMPGLPPRISARILRGNSQPVVALRLMTHLLKELRTTDRSRTVVHATTWRTAALIAVLPRWWAPAYAVSVHGREVTSAGRALGLFMRFVFRRAAAVVAVSETTAMHVRSAVRRDVTVSLNGPGLTPKEICKIAELRHDTSSLADAVRILTVCRLVPRKNVGGLLHALAEIRSRGTKVDATIVGNGDEWERLLQLRRNLGLADCVDMRGVVSQDELLKLYASSHIFVHPQIATQDGADFEGFGLVIADAMASELAVVAGEAGGPAELIRDDVTGFLIDGSDTAAIVDAITRLLQDADLRQRLGSEASLHARSALSWQTHVRDVLRATAAESPG